MRSLRHTNEQLWKRPSPLELFKINKYEVIWILFYLWGDKNQNHLRDQQLEIERGRERGDKWTYYLPPHLFQIFLLSSFFIIGLFHFDYEPWRTASLQVSLIQVSKRRWSRFSMFHDFFKSTYTFYVHPGVRLLMSSDTQKETNDNPNLFSLPLTNPIHPVIRWQGIGFL